MVPYGHEFFMETIRLKSNQGNTTNLNIYFSSMENEYRAAQEVSNHDLLLTREVLYPVSYQDGLAGWVESRQYKARATSLT